MDCNFRPKICFPNAKWVNGMHLQLGEPQVSFDEWHKYQINKRLYYLLMCLKRVDIWIPLDIAYLLRKEISRVYFEERRNRLDRLKLLKKFNFFRC